MKKYILTICVASSGLLFGQVTIGKDLANIQPASAAVSIEFGNSTGVQNKGVVLPYVTATINNTVTGAVPGTLVFDAAASQQKVKFARANAANSTSVFEWFDLSNGALMPSPAIVPETGTDISTAKVQIGGATSDSTPGILVLADNTKAMVLPRVTSVASIENPSPGMMVYVTGTAVGAPQQLAVFNGREWSFWAAEVTTVTSPTTGRIWMDRNLGASQVATSSADPLAYGSLYQWGRLTDGHQVRGSGTLTTQSATDVPGNANFITYATDWRSGSNNSLWQGVSGINNPCPSGFRIPTLAEFQAETAITNAATAFSSPLKLTVGGSRTGSTGALAGVGTTGNYYTSTITSGLPSVYVLAPAGTTAQRATGASVRCIKN